MKLVSLNIWGAKQGKVFFNYISSLAATTHVFCFQEVFFAGPGAPAEYDGYRMFLFQELQALLPEFVGYFEARSSGYADDSLEQVAWPVSHGLAVFVKKTLSLTSYQSKIVEDSKVSGVPPVDGPVKSQVLTLAKDGRSFHVINTHGLSRPVEKLDTPERLNQSRKLLEIIAGLPSQPVILCGDFNLMPKTQSIQMLEQNLKNLITDFNITDTRNSLSRGKYKDSPQYFADFTFVSKGLAVKSFQVPYNEVSDHLPMILEFEL